MSLDRETPAVILYFMTYQFYMMRVYYAVAVLKCLKVTVFLIFLSYFSSVFPSMCERA